jgi:hypothetical protein
VGRWQKNKDLFWWSKAGEGEPIIYTFFPPWQYTGHRLDASSVRVSPPLVAEDKQKLEREAIRRRDEELINQALGLAPKKQ